MKILKNWIVTFGVSALLIYCVSIIHIQTGARTLNELQAQDAEMVEKSAVEPSAIPMDHVAAVRRVINDLGQKELERLRELSRIPEEKMDQLLWFELSSYGHHGLGTSIRNNFGFWKDSRLSRWYSWRGYRDPDSKSAPILDDFRAFVLEGKEPSNLITERLIVLVILSFLLASFFRFLVFLVRFLGNSVNKKKLQPLAPGNADKPPA